MTSSKMRKTSHDALSSRPSPPAKLPLKPSSSCSETAITQEVSGFQGLPVNNRKALLDALMDQLSYGDREYVRQGLSRRARGYDILGQLPLDLVCIIAGFLDPATIVRLRRVCRRWRSVLSAEAVCMQSCRAYWPWAKPPPMTLWSDYLFNRAHGEFSLSVGSPWTKAGYNLHDLAIPAAARNQSQLWGDKFAWHSLGNPGSREHIAVLHFATGEVRQYFPSRETALLGEPMMSDLLVGCMAAEGNCEVFELSSGIRYSLALPSAHYRQLIVQGDKIACYSEPDRSLLCWDLRSKIRRNVQLDIIPGSLITEIVPLTKLEFVLGYESVHILRLNLRVSLVLRSETGMAIQATAMSDNFDQLCLITEIRLKDSKVANRVVLDGATEGIYCSQLIKLDDRLMSVKGSSFYPYSLDRRLCHWFRMQIGDLNCHIFVDDCDEPPRDLMYSWRVIEDDMTLVPLSPCVVCSIEPRFASSVDFDGYDIEFFSWSRPGCVNTAVALFPDIENEMENTALRGALSSLDNGGNGDDPALDPQASGDVNTTLSSSDAEGEIDSAGDNTDGELNDANASFYGNDRFLLRCVRGRLAVVCFDRTYKMANEDARFNETRKAHKFHCYEGWQRVQVADNNCMEQPTFVKLPLGLPVGEEDD